MLSQTITVHKSRIVRYLKSSLRLKFHRRLDLENPLVDAIVVDSPGIRIAGVYRGFLKIGDDKNPLESFFSTLEKICNTHKKP